MDFIKEFGKFLDVFGTDTVVKYDSTNHSVKALVEPLRYKNKMYLEMKRDLLGYLDKECFLYLGPASADFTGKEADTEITYGGAEYTVSRADKIFLGSEKLYIWAILSPKNEEVSP